MTVSKLATETRWTHQKSSRDGTRVDRFIVHHAANTSVDQTLNLFAGARQVSANYALGNGRIVAAVPEEERAWTSGSGVDDKRAITVEVSNSHTGDPWPVADKEFDNLARLIADVATRYGFPINDDTVLTHQELYTRFRRSYATACPGDLQRRKAELIELANHYTNPAPTILQEDDEMLFLRIANKYMVSVSTGVLTHWGPETTQPVRETAKNVGRINDDWQEVSFEVFAALLKAYGCDKNIWDVRTFGKETDFCVVNPLDGSVKQGNTWSATNALRAEIKGITQPKIDTAPIVAAAKAGAKAGAEAALSDLTLKAVK